MTEASDAPQAGWYEAPNDDVLWRYWDGGQWTALYRNQGAAQNEISADGATTGPVAEAELIQFSCPKCTETWLVPANADQWRCGNFNCGRKWLLLQCRFCGGPQHLASTRRGESCRWCRKPGFRGKATNIAARRFYEDAARLGSPLDANESDRRALLGCVVIGGFGHQMPSGTKLNVVFDRDEVRFATVDYGGDNSAIRYQDITALDIEGRGIVRSGSQVMGGGFGFSGAAEGMLAASLLNSLTARSRIETVVNLRTPEWGLILFYDQMPPVNLKRHLSAAFSQIEAAHRSAQTGSSKQDPVAQLAQLKVLLDGGALTADEFATAKAKLLAEM